MVKYYSPVDSSDFENDTCNKKEFTKYSISNASNSRRNSLKPHQQWIANYINPKTPFKGLLVYHETGTGKTCTAISVAENFREELARKRKKIYILSSENIKEEFYRTISNPGGSFKCTGDTYHDMLASAEITQKNINSKINQFYTFMTHYTFGARLMDAVSNLLANGKSNDDIIEYIKKEFSSSVIIIDEAQHLRAKFDSSDKKKSGEKPVHDAIDLITKYAEDVKILFLTATPMYDNPTEIIWIINVLIRLNESKGTEELDINDIFLNENHGYAFTPTGEEKFINAIKGKVTFLRNGDPKNFPLSLSDPDALGKWPEHIKYDFNGGPLPDAEVPVLTISKMSKKHYKIIEKHNNSPNTDSFHMQQMQMHNVSWHTKMEEDSNDSPGLQQYFKITQSDGSPKLYKPLNPNLLDNLSEFAPKVQTIVNHILEMESGIAFIFSQFISSGVVPMILALEANGFSKYDGKAADIKHLDQTNIRDKGRYLVITSDKELSASKKQQLEWINVARGTGNEYGDNIRVIIASGSGGEGIDLKWIRQVHIMEPHFHFSQIEQAVGRAIRNASHIELDKPKRNCTIFYHATIYPDNIDKESVDMYLYRIAMRKRKATNNVRRIIQENSITCKFFKKLNNFDYESYENTTIIDSKGKKHKFSQDMIIDDEYSNICKSCTSAAALPDEHTYDPKIHSKWQLFESMRVIQKIFKQNNIYSLEDIIISVQKYNKQIDKETIYFALDILINNPIKTFENEMGTKGRVSYNGDLYYFKPDWYEYKELESIPEVTPLVLANPYVNLDTIPWLERPVIANSAIEEQYKLILSKPNMDSDSFWSNIEEKNDLIADVLIDRISSDEREMLLKKNSLTIPSLKKSLSRYVLEDGFMDIKSIKVPYDIKPNYIQTSARPGEKPALPGKRRIYAYIDIIKGLGTLYLTDTTEGKASGRRILPSEKKRAIKYINYLVTYKGDNDALMSYDRYVEDTKTLQVGQLHSLLKLNHNVKNISFKADDLIIECEMLFRLLELRRPSNSKKWFYNSWESFENKIPSKDKSS